MDSEIWVDTRRITEDTQRVFAAAYLKCENDYDIQSHILSRDKQKWHIYF